MPEDGDNAETYRSSVTEKNTYIVELCTFWCYQSFNIQGDSVARGPKLLSIKNYVIEIMT